METTEEGPPAPFVGLGAGGRLLRRFFGRKRSEHAHAHLRSSTIGETSAAHAHVANAKRANAPRSAPNKSNAPDFLRSDSHRLNPRVTFRRNAEKLR